jgi:serine/threonine protein kinase
VTGRELTVPGLTGFAVLARGGYATVYRAVQESVGREVAVKVENRRLESDRDQRRFLREARAAGRMSGHPHVVDLFDAGVRPDGHPYLIMELCEGSYAERSKIAPLDPCEARDVGIKIADALGDAHALGVLHRDVKPENILVTRFGEPALADFGLAILSEARDVSVTFDVLTPAYAPPEFFWSARPGTGGDVYGLCATLYTLLRGRPPRWGDDGNPSLVSIVDMFAQWVPDLPGVPGEFTSLLRSGMANDPAARPSAVELRDALLTLRLATYLSPAPRQRTPSGTTKDFASTFGAVDNPAITELPTQAIRASDLVADPSDDDGAVDPRDHDRGDGAGAGDSQPPAEGDEPGDASANGGKRRWRWWYGRVTTPEPCGPAAPDPG